MSIVFPRLYAIMDAGLIKTSLMACAEMLAEAGVAIVQIRDKRASSRDFLQVSMQLSGFFKRRGVRLIVNDRPDLVLLADAGGVHLGQDDVEYGVARLVCGGDRWVGISTHSVEQVRRANESPLDYIAVGPIFPTSTKSDPGPSFGLDLIRRARALTTKPLVAIGGITLELAPKAFEAGADSIAVAKALLICLDPERRAKDFLAVTSKG